MALLVFAGTLFVSAFILFLVQPIIGKLILPKLGGTPQVWNTCMVFFQMVLLAGYAYTHTVSTKLRLRSQLIVHGLLLLAPIAILFFMSPKPFDIDKWMPPPGANPLFATLGILAVVVGIPFFVVSTSAPLLQKWFVSTGHPSAKDPYHLYSASNLGSLLSLFVYPAIMEPFTKLQNWPVPEDHKFFLPQTWFWAFSYVLLLITVVVCIAMVWKPAAHQAKLMEDHPSSQPSPQPSTMAPAPNAPQPNTAVTASPPLPASQRSTAFKKGAKPGPKFAPRKETAAAPDIGAIKATDEVTGWRRLRWIGLAAVPSSLMLGVTTHITTDLSPIPLFWLLPLALYLLSFILVFSRWPVPWVGTPHTYMLYAQPVFIAMMIFGDFYGASAQDLFAPIFLNLLAFFATAIVCHGELAKDRPTTKHLTEFYLMMSLGGMLGGMFNGLIAPIVFVRVWEFAIAVIAACFLRPKLKEGGWSDELVSGVLEPQGASPAQRGAKAAGGGGTALETTSTAMDFILPIANAILLVLLVFVFFGPNREREPTKADIGLRTFLNFGIVLTISCFFYGRPIRYGLTIAAVFIVHAFMISNHDTTIYSDRSYFGIIRIKTSYAEEGKPYSTLIHGHIDHGMNLFKPADEKYWGNDSRDFSRLATTYYHRLGPAGIVMGKFNWWGQNLPADATNVELNSYKADARMPASLVGALASPFDQVGACMPLAALVDLWSEPPYATIGLGTGTMASYGRPYQHVHYYEIDNHIRKLSLPKGKAYFTRESLQEVQEPPFVFEAYAGKSSGQPKTYFTYLKDAIMRGCEVQVLMGDARLRMALPYKNFHAKLAPGELPGGGPDDFYHMMVVDAFTSDAIPAHLLTKEAFQMYFQKLTEDGILCVHTSNRYVELPLVVADVATSLGYHYSKGHDSPDPSTRGKQIGHHSSEWVMVARKAEYMKFLQAPPNYEGPKVQGGEREQYWSIPPSSGRRYLWTDDYYNLLSIIRW